MTLVQGGKTHVSNSFLSYGNLNSTGSLMNLTEPPFIDFCSQRILSFVTPPFLAHSLSPLLLPLSLPPFTHYHSLALTLVLSSHVYSHASCELGNRSYEVALTLTLRTVPVSLRNGCKIDFHFHFTRPKQNQFNILQIVYKIRAFPGDGKSLLNCQHMLTQLLYI